VKRQQSGVALISIMLVVALVSALVYHLVSRQSLVVAQTRQSIYGDRALAYALGAEAYARQLLFEDWNREETRSIDTLTESWALPGAPFEVEGGTLEILIRDLDGRFNLNALADPGDRSGLSRFKNLLAAVGLDPTLADRWRDWVDADSETTGFGAEDNFYLGLDLPFRTANRPVASISELRLIDGMTAEGYRAIESAVTALPKLDARININTAGALAMMSLSPQLSLAKAQSLIESDRQYLDTQTLAGEVPELNSSLEAMKVTSDFFEVLARAEVNGVRTDLRSVLHRDPLDGRVTLLSRDLGHRFPLRRLDVEEEGSS